MSGQVRFGLKLPNCGGILCPPQWAAPETITELASLASATGYSSVWMQDHLVTPAELVSLGRLQFFDPIVLSAKLAEMCPGMSMGMATLILPLRDPVVLAKQLMSLDALYPGRIIAGIGTGLYQSEYDAVGVDWSKRGRLADEYLEILTHLMSGEEETSMRGEFRQIGKATMWPRPEDGALQVWIAGNAERPLRRAAKYGTGWICAALDPEEVRSSAGKLEVELEKVGRDRSGFRIALSTTVDRRLEYATEDRTVHRHSKTVSGSTMEVLDTFSRHVAAGVTDILVTFSERGLGELKESVEWLSKEIMRRLRVAA